MAQQFQFGDYTKNAPLASFVNGYRREQERQRQIKRQQEQDKQAAAKLALEAKVVEQRGKLIENEARKLALQNELVEFERDHWNRRREAETLQREGAANLVNFQGDALAARIPYIAPRQKAEIRGINEQANEAAARADRYRLEEGFLPDFWRARNRRANAEADSAKIKADYDPLLFDSRLGMEAAQTYNLGQQGRILNADANARPDFNAHTIDLLRARADMLDAQRAEVAPNAAGQRELWAAQAFETRGRGDIHVIDTYTRNRRNLAGIAQTMAQTDKLQAEINLLNIDSNTRDLLNRANIRRLRAGADLSLASAGLAKANTRATDKRTSRYDEVTDMQLAHTAALIRGAHANAEMREMLNKFVPERERASIDNLLADTGVKDGQARLLGIDADAKDFDLQVKRKGQAALDALAAGKGDPGENMTKALISGLDPILVSRIAAMRMSQIGKGAKALIKTQREKQDAAAKAEAWAAQNKEWAAAADSLADFVSGDDDSFMRVFTTLSPDNPVHKAAVALGWRHFAPAPDAELARKTAASLAERGETEIHNAGMLAKEAADIGEQVNKNREEGQEIVRGLNGIDAFPTDRTQYFQVPGRDGAPGGLVRTGTDGAPIAQQFPDWVGSGEKGSSSSKGQGSKQLLPSYQHPGSAADMVALSVSDPGTLWGNFARTADIAGAQKVLERIDKAKEKTADEDVQNRRQGLDVLISAHENLMKLAKSENKVGDVSALVAQGETLLRESGGGGTFGAALQKWNHELKLTYEGNVLERWGAAVRDWASGKIPPKQMENLADKFAVQIDLYKRYGKAPIEKVRRDMEVELKGWNLTDAQGRRLPPDQVEAMAINFADYFMGIGNNDQNSVAPERLQQGAGALAQDPATAAATPAAPPPAAGLAQGQSNTGAGESMDKLFANPQQPVGDLPQRMRAAFDKYAEIIGSNNGLNSSQEENASRLFAEAGARAYGIKFGNFAEAQKAFQGAPGWHKMYGLKGEEKMIVGQKTAEPPGLEAVLADLQDVGQDGAPDGVQQIKYYPGQGAFISLELRDNYNNNMPEGGDYPAGIALAWVSEAALKSQDKPQRLANITLFFTNQEPMTAEKLI